MVCFDDDAQSSDEPTIGEALTLFGMQRGTLVTTRNGRDGGDDDDARAPLSPPRKGDAVEHERFNLHASIRLEAHDHVGRERLCRYLTRPAFSLERLRVPTAPWPTA